MPDSGHTPLPWRIKYGPKHSQDEADIMVAGDIFILADINGPNYAHCEANAEFIVRACNSHSALIEALEEARDYFDNRADAEYFTDSPTPVPNEEMRLLCEIDAALTLARKDQTNG